MRLQKVLRGALAVVFFLLCLQMAVFSVRALISEEGVCNAEGPFGVILPTFVFFAAFFLAALFFLWQWWREGDEKQGLFWLLLLSAGGSNALERLMYGCIFDFLALPFFPLFNVADVVLSASVVFLLWREFRRKR